mmetsp:Transcript_39492/g.97776  ORF Transcript_39492/g.97776 Transcript_39492/m.97776 type:complete len:201 (-) Transcript_39492:318-920(-)
MPAPLLSDMEMAAAAAVASSALRSAAALSSRAFSSLDFSPMSSSSGSHVTRPSSLRRIPLTFTRPVTDPNTELDPPRYTVPRHSSDSPMSHATAMWSSSPGPMSATPACPWAHRETTWTLTSRVSTMWRPPKEPSNRLLIQSNRSTFNLGPPLDSSSSFSSSSEASPDAVGRLGTALDADDVDAPYAAEIFSACSAPVSM